MPIPPFFLAASLVPDDYGEIGESGAWLTIVLVPTRLGASIGGPCWNRTNDHLIKSQMLYRLS